MLNARTIIVLIIGVALGLFVVPKFMPGLAA